MDTLCHRVARGTLSVLLIATSPGAGGFSRAHAKSQEESPNPRIPDSLLPHDPPPPPTREPLFGLVIGGALTQGSLWGLSILTAGVCDAWNHHFDHGTTDSAGTPKCDTWPLYIPVLGPWLTMGFVHKKGATDPLVDALLAFDGLGQAAGLAMLIGGALGRSQVPALARLQFTPLPYSRGSGVLVSGRF